MIYLQIVANSATILVAIVGIVAGYYKLTTAVKLLDWRVRRLEERDRIDKRHPRDRIT